MRYTQFIILLLVSLTIIVTSGICLGSSKTLKDTQKKQTINNVSLIVLGIGVALFLVSLYTLYKARTQIISTVVIKEPSFFRKLSQTLIGFGLIVCGVILEFTASSLDETSTEKKNISNAATVIIIIGAGIAGKLIIDLYNRSVSGITQEQFDQQTRFKDLEQQFELQKQALRDALGNKAK